MFGGIVLLQNTVTVIKIPKFEYNDSAFESASKSNICLQIRQLCFCDGPKNKKNPQLGTNLISIILCLIWFLACTFCRCKVFCKAIEAAGQRGIIDDFWRVKRRGTLQKGVTLFCYQFGGQALHYLHLSRPKAERNVATPIMI